MSIERYSARTTVDFVSWAYRNPERAFDMGMKLMGIGAVLAILAAIARALNE